MSNYWRLRCATCKDDCSARWNRGEETAKALARQFSELVTVAEIFDRIEVVEVELQAHGEHFSLSWSLKHKGHDVRATDEYGRVYTLAGELDRALSTRDEDLHKIEKTP